LTKVRGANVKAIIKRPDGYFEYAEDVLKRCQAVPGRYGPTIRRLARHAGLYAKKRKGAWYFADHSNRLVSPEPGLTDGESLGFLLEERRP
jgi:hypothetical protein